MPPGERSPAVHDRAFAAKEHARKIINLKLGPDKLARVA
jgi:hypothetical protein